MSTSDTTLQRSRAKRRIAVENRIYPVLAGAAVGILILGTVVYHYLEDWSWVDSFYFSAVTGSTVGFGDLTPSTDVSKLFTVVYIFSSIAILGTFLNERLKYHGVVVRRAKKVVSDSQGDGSA
ncbi:MAG: potassium channel family protein [Actinomycetia bacterium]|nr:potassium channel family protein [Actinomycetes bacterium]